MYTLCFLYELSVVHFDFLFVLSAMYTYVSYLVVLCTLCVVILYKCCVHCIFLYCIGARYSVSHFVYNVIYTLCGSHFV